MKIEHDGKYCASCTENSMMPSLPKCNDEKKERILIEDAPFTIRAHNAFRRLMVNYLDEICVFTAGELLSHGQFGRQTLRETRKILSLYGLSLRGDLVLDTEADKKLIQDIPKFLMEFQKEFNVLRRKIEFLCEALDQMHANMQPIKRDYE